jgi:hypothetical protein
MTTTHEHSTSCQCPDCKPRRQLASLVAGALLTVPLVIGTLFSIAAGMVRR